MAVVQRANPGRALAAGLVLTLGFAVVEVALGLISGSLALVSDAGHMLVDSAGLVLALGATALARRPSDLRRTYGYARVEVLVVPLHVLLMAGLAAYIVFEAVGRVGETPSIEAGPVLAAGVAGLGLNLLVMRLLRGHAERNLNARGALFESFADALGSVGVLVSGAVIVLTGWTPVDLIVSLVIAALVAPRAIALLRSAISILLEGTPPGIVTEALERDARRVDGVRALHDLHVWALAPGFVALSAHVEVDRMENGEAAISGLSELFRDRYGIDHVTLQPETRALHDAIACCASPDSAGLAGHVHTVSR